MKATCMHPKCEFKIKNICSKYPLFTICKITGLDIIPDRPIPKIEKPDEYDLFKKFIIQLRREINENDTKLGLCSNKTNFAFGFDIIQEVDALVTAITSDDIDTIKKELFKISCNTYKMWRNL